MKPFLRLLAASLAASTACVILFGLLVWFATERIGTVMSLHGWIALAVGVFFTVMLTAGLMALLFYSRRAGHDQAAHDMSRKFDPGR